MDETLPDLGDLEREVMQLVWAKGPVTAEAVREELARRLKESTVRSVEEVLVGMVDTAMLDRKRLRMLTDRITQTKSGKK